MTETRTVPVTGGGLAVREWNPDAAGRAVVALHGITASHLAWQELASRLPDVRIIAPDLRGRGRSRALPGPYGLDTHADDVAALITELRLDHPLVVGHSMGGFVTVQLVRAHPGAVGGVLLIDGGLPLQSAAATPEDATALLGPAAERLRMTFESRSAYRDFWQRHPAFADDWSDSIERYVDYDLIDSPDGLRPSTVPEAMLEDSLWLARDAGVVDDLNAWPHEIPLLAAPRGLQDEPVPLYASDDLDRWRSAIPRLRPRIIEDVNHYTIVMGARGADAVAAALRDQLASLTTNAATEVRS
ncbi:Pimeloyl-ACP methyl ester carboxylesterase [Paramicrobacterium humi]|uniref:Pimeloyl-ACP methyl ester carboxylesterase n=1 Tax=Paramicrobacterium humi TaxID=640635 RepID=A0A1H4PH60_9MICO|nr:alpha/beta hydrolase [Microbacterium humi]SEC06777.1 Pimeloyl-ACP methyl ester carboxylesterase [Microbacterium humi]